MSIDTKLQEIFQHNQERLPVELRCIWDAEWCLERSLNSYICSCIKGHAGDHAAHGRLGTILYQWPKVQS